MNDTITRDFANVPANAFQFKADLNIGKNGEGAKTAPVKMLARSSEPIEHWYWGRIVHDMAGAKPSKPRIAIDYCHRQDEVLGYLNKFEVTDEGYVTSGAITPFNAEDRASEVLFKAEAGVPYEASINFYGENTVIEVIPENAFTKVNGVQFDGPGVVVREWVVRGVAICLYGADQNTRAEFSEQTKPLAVSVKAFSQEPNMSAAATTATTTTNPGAEAKGNTTAVDASNLKQGEPKPAESPAKPGAVDTGKLTAGEAAAGGNASAKVVDPAAKKFTDAFGKDGAMFFVEGTSFEEAASLFITTLKADHEKAIKAKDDQIALLNQKLDAAKQFAGGDSVPPRLDGSGKKETPADPKLLAATGSEGLAKFASLIKLPGKPEAPK